jgi:hypothetical protein
MAGSRSFDQIRADLPTPSESLSEAHEDVLAMLNDPERVWRPDHRADCIAGLSEINGAGALINSLISEWKSSRHATSVFSAGLGELNGAKRAFNEMKSTFETALAEMRAEHQSANGGSRWKAAEASIIALRRIDNALAPWRQGRIPTQDHDTLLSDVDCIVNDFYRGGPPEMEA